MKKLLLLFAILGGACIGYANTKTAGNIQFFIKSQYACPVSTTAYSATIDVPVQVNGFTQLISAQGSLLWDSSKFSFNSISNFGSTALALSSANFNSPANGTLLFLWNDGPLTGQTLSDSSILFVLRLNVKVNTVATSSSNLTFSNSPLNFECLDVNVNNLNISLQNAAINFVQAAQISASGQNSFCIGGSVQLTTSATGTFQWKNNNNNISNATNSTYNATTTGAYTVAVSDATTGCVLPSNAITVNVNPKPAVNFSINNANQCLTGNSFVYTNSTTISKGTFTSTWNLGDGTTSRSTSPSAKSYTTDSTYFIKLIAKSDSGCTDSVVKAVVVYPRPAASFAVNNLSQCVNSNSFALTNTSTIKSGTLTYVWSFGDGTLSTQTSPSKTYSTANSFSIQLTATSAFGCTGSALRSVTVLPKPNPAFTINNASQCVNSQNFSFTNNSTISTGTLTYVWNFSDTTTQTTTNASKTFAQAGSYSIKLSATSNNGCVDSLTKNVSVLPKPNVQFTVNSNAQCITGNNFVFTNNSNITSGNLSATWNFNDGNTSTLFTNVSKSYTNSGTYTVKLVVKSDSNCSDSASNIINVYANPTAKFAVNKLAQCVVNNNYTFTNQSVANTGSLSYLWNYGDNSNTDTITSPSYVYASTGNYIVKLVATNDKGCKDSFSTTVFVTSVPTLSSITSNSPAVLNDTIKLNATSLDTGITYNWSGPSSFQSTLSNPTIAAVTASMAGWYVVFPTRNGCAGKSDSTNVIVNALVQGRIINPTGNNVVRNVVMRLNGANTGILSDNQGRFSIPVAIGTNAVLRGFKNNDVSKTNGVNAIDLALLQSHILQRSKLNSPYKLIAADADGNGNITTLDIVFIKRLILGIDTTIRGRLWAFVDSSYVFPNSTQPFPFKDSIVINNQSASAANNTFIGVKLGDVNLDWNASVLKQNPINQNNQWLYFGNAVEDETGLLKLPVYAKQALNVVGAQIQFTSPEMYQQLVRVEPSQWNIQPQSYFTTKQNELNMVYVDEQLTPQTIDVSKPLFYLVLSKSAQVNAIQLGNQPQFENFVFDAEYNKTALKLGTQSMINQNAQDAYACLLTDAAIKIVFDNASVNEQSAIVKVYTVDGKLLANKPVTWKPLAKNQSMLIATTEMARKQIVLVSIYSNGKIQKTSKIFIP